MSCPLRTGSLLHPQSVYKMITGGKRCKFDFSDIINMQMLSQIATGW